MMDADRPVADLPEWFLKNCVKTSREISGLAAQISLQRKPSKQVDVVPPKDTDKPTGQTTKECYEVEPCIYDTLLGLVAKDKDGDGDGDGVPSFTNDAVLLRLPESDYPGRDFLVSMAAKLANDVAADMIVLNSDDLYDLAEYFFLSQESNIDCDMKNKAYIDVLLRRPSKKKPPPPETKPKSSSDSDASSVLSLPHHSESSSDASSGSDSDAVSVLSLDSTSKPRQPMDEAQVCRPPRPTGTNTYLLSNRDEKLKSALSGEAFEPCKRQNRVHGVLSAFSQLFPTLLSPLRIIPGLHSYLPPLEEDHPEPPKQETVVEKPVVKDQIKENGINLFRSILTSPHARAALEQKNDQKEEESSKETNEAAHFTFQKTNSERMRPVIIVIPQFEKLRYLANYAFRGLKSVISQSPHLESRLLTIATTSRSEKPPPSLGRRPVYSDPVPDLGPPLPTGILRRLGRRPDFNELLIFPHRSPAQLSSFTNDKEHICQQKSIRAIQREVRRIKKNKDLEHLQPYAKWEVPESATDPVVKYLRSGKLQEIREIQKVGELLLKTKKFDQVQKIFTVLTQVSEGSDAFDKWNDKDAKGASAADLPPRVARVIKRVTEEAERSCSEFNPDLEIMKTLVHPSELTQGWTDIEVEPAIKTRVKRMVSLLNRRSKLTGILRKSAMGGVILYGPPGTGKTHLARIIAKETSSVMLRISAAEIERTWAGESEKVIKALFKLAREIYPCIVFIDEADAIFGRRRDSDKNWERKITNQLLGEFGGFENDTTAPLLLLATNFPNDLDPAVLRRAPNRLYMGLPSTPSRQNIFKICLRDEAMDTSVNFEELAEKTSGYTGSDIEYICQQAAMAALEDFEVEDDQESGESGDIYLKMEHFSQSLAGASPSVSGSSLTGIESFAREYDRSAVDIIKKTTDEYSGFTSYLYI